MSLMLRKFGADLIMGALERVECMYPADPAFSELVTLYSKLYVMQVSEMETPRSISP